jgi:hypothetical protein
MMTGVAFAKIRESNRAAVNSLTFFSKHIEVGLHNQDFRLGMLQTSNVESMELFINRTKFCNLSSPVFNVS